LSGSLIEYAYRFHDVGSRVDPSEESCEMNRPDVGSYHRARKYCSPTPESVNSPLNPNDGTMRPDAEGGHLD